MRAFIAALVSLALAFSTPQRTAHAFCGFYVSGSADRLLNNATEVALMRSGTRTALSMSNHYQGPAANFAMVVPVPIVLQQENVKTLPKNVFDHLDQLTSPRLVEYWEIDPCWTPPPPPRYMGRRYPSSPPPMQSSPIAGHGVRVEAQFTVGEYDIVVLSADQSNGLETWLHENHYNIPNGAARMLEPYVRDQWKFFVAKIDITKVNTDANGVAELSPLRFHYDSPEFRLPVRLGLLNAPDAQDLIVYVLSDNQRYEVANYRNVFIPTNLEVENSVRDQFPAFYTRLFDATMASAGTRAVVTEYAWSVNSCDPCPGPPMADGETRILGGDVMPNAQNAAPNYGSYTVTRLHTRYNAATLTEDLVFREASAVVGGRETLHNANGEVEQGAQEIEGGASNFQGRYIIRHRWEGAIGCRNPVRGRWGGPPGSGPGSPPSSNAAPNLGTAPRGDFELPPVVKTPTPGVDLSARLVLPPVPAQIASDTDAGSATSADAAGDDVAQSSSTQAATGSTSRPAANRGCACSTPGGQRESSSPSWIFLALAFVRHAARRRRG